MNRRAIRTKVNTAGVRLALAGLALTVVLGVLAVGIVLTHADDKGKLLANFRARGATSAGFVSTYVQQQGARESRSAQQFLSGHQGLAPEFARVAAAFGSSTAVLLDSSGRVLGILPTDPALAGVKIAQRYRHLSAAEAGHVAVSGVVPSAVRHEPVVAIAAPYPTPYGRRVFSPAYPITGSVLATFVEHTIALKPHLVLLLDASGNVISASPRTSATTLIGASPALAGALADHSQNGAQIGTQPSTFVATPVAGTPWRLVITEPNRLLFGSVDGWALWLPWIVFSMIAALAVIVLSLFSRSLASRSRLETLSVALADAARTDSVTGLANRRSLEESLIRASAYANRYGESLSALMIDFDDFKRINDTRGHETGDEVLRAVAECMRRVFRQSDIFGRWGGDEFLAILPGRSDEAVRAGERLCAEVKALESSRYGLSQQITLSIGCASATKVSPHDLLSEADSALYRAKRGGRDQVAAA
jgi:diguanylate cyclase (GGDEF)-like protein